MARSPGRLGGVEVAGLIASFAWVSAYLAAAATECTNTLYLGKIWMWNAMDLGENRWILGENWLILGENRWILGENRWKKEWENEWGMWFWRGCRGLGCFLDPVFCAMVKLGEFIG